MESKYKIIITLFLLVILLYVGSYLFNYITQTKKRESFMEDDDMLIEEKFTENTKPKKSSEKFDQRVVILNTVEKFVEDKGERVAIMTEMFENLNDFSNMSRDDVINKVKDYIESRKESMVTSESKVNADGDYFEEEPAIPSTPASAPATSPSTAPAAAKPTSSDPKIKESMTKMSTDIDQMYSQFGMLQKNFNELKNNMLTEKMTQQQTVPPPPPKKAVQTSSIEHFIDGFENVSNYASYELL